MYPCYGLAEATVIVTGGAHLTEPTVFQLDAEALKHGLVELAAAGAKSHALVGCGRTFEGHLVVIVDFNTHEPCAPDRIGEIWTAGPNVAQGYWNQPEETERTLHARLEAYPDQRFLRTGDLGFLRKGQLFVTGRLKDLIIIRGHNHYPQDIEFTTEHSHIALASNGGAAFSVDGDGEERLVIVHEFERSARRTNPAEVVTAIREAVSQDHGVTPVAIALLKPGHLIRTSSGKVQRHACRKAFLDCSLQTMHVWRRKLPSVGNVAPALVELEQWLVGELAKAGNLRPDQIDPRSPLAHYSLDSLKLTELAGQIEDRLHIHLPVETVIGTTSLAELVMKLQDLLLEKTSSKPAQALVKPSPTSHEASADSEMQSNEEYSGGENFCLHQILLKGRNLKLKERAASVQAFVDRLYEHREQFHMRLVMSPSDREVLVMDPYTHQPRSMRMFGSNDYLGLANHPEVIAAASCALREYGAGIGGPPLFNGYTALHRQFEERLALLKGTEDALIFSSGYAANVGLATGLFNATDVVLYDAYSHASFIDGIKMSGVSAAQFPHNDIESLGRLIATHRRKARGDIFVGVEGVYSMDGDLAPLDEIVQLCRASGAILLVDDAHGTGVMGATGKGTAEHFNIEGQVDITMGTFSKTFAVSGGFIAATKPIVSVLRFFARSYMFSASLPPVGVATVLAGLDVLERHPHLVVRLRENVRYTAQRLRELGFDVNPQAAIISLRVPEWMNIRQAAYKFHERGIFVNSVEFPAVPLAQQRFRISLMATHTHNDIDRLLSVVAAVWAEAKSEQPRVSVDSNT